MKARSWVHLSATASLSLLAAGTLPAGEVSFHSSAAKASLVELYTSEGCSSCPPAEAWLNGLKSSDTLWKTVFPVSFHVDYWDGLGWPDRFARADYTDRQREYAARLGQDSVYTPEFVVDGAESRGWFHGRALGNPGAKAGDLALTVRDGKIAASFAPGSTDAATKWTLNVALLGMDLVTDVKRGENGGRQLTHDFVALALKSVPLAAGEGGRWSAAPFDLVSATGDSPAAVVGWVSGSDGSIRQIAGGWTKP